MVIKAIKIFYLTFLIFILLYNNVFSWGYKVHYEITKRACEILSRYFGENFKYYTEYIAEHSDLPDKWKSYYAYEGYGYLESPNHYCDYDYYLKLDRIDLDNEIKIIKKHFTQQELKDGGTVIWAIEEYSKLLKNALESKDFLTSLIYMAVISHYLEDIHQPFHSTLNYDGQLTGNDGIHLRYEIYMIDLHWNKPEIEDIDTVEILDLKNIRKFVISILEDSLSNVEPILKADTNAKKIDPTFSSDYYKNLWEDVKEITNEQINKAVISLVSLFYSIWLEAGSPEFPESLQLIPPDKLNIERVIFFDEQDSRNKTSSIDNKKLYSSILVIVLFFASIFLLKNK